MLTRTVRSIVLALVAGLALVVGPAGGPGTAYAAEGSACRPADASPVVPVCVGTYNIQAGTSMEEFRSGVDAFKQRVDVAGLQEIGRNDKNQYLLSDWSWGYYRPEQLQQNPVIWDYSVFDLVEARGALLAEGRDVGDEKPSNPEFRKDSYATVVRLQHRVTGQLVSVINVHLVSGAVKAGRPWPDRPLLYAMYTEQVASLARLQARERELGQVLVLGDFNVGYKADRTWHLKPLPYRKLTNRGLVSMWRDHDVDHGGTHNDAYIDQVWSTAPVLAATVATDIEAGDHYPAIATYGLRLVPGWVPPLPLPPLGS